MREQQATKRTWTYNQTLLNWGFGVLGFWGFGGTAISSFASHFALNGVGPLGGGYFEDKNDSGKARAGYGDFGVWGSGEDAGGYFTDPATGVWARVGEGVWGLRTTGSLLAYAIPFATPRPIRNPVNEPGPILQASKSIS